MCDIDEDAPICSQCDGSGEGMYDGTKCHACGGSGIARGYASDPDEDRDEDAERELFNERNS